MAKISFHVDPVLQALDEQLVASRKVSHGYMGASNIGDDCSRKLWYGFRRASSERIPAKGLKAINDGHRGEAAMGERLSALPFLQLWTAKPDGTQYGAKLFGGHFKCFVDGVIKGLPQSPTKPHVWEHKVCGEKKFAELVRTILKQGPQAALQKWNPTYYAQAQVSMHVLDLDRHYCTVESAGSRDTISLRTYRKKKEAQAFVDKARNVVFNAEPPPRISERPAYFVCRWCMHSETCHGQLAPRVTCRTCAHVTPAHDGSWRCERHGRTLDNDDACEAHRYIPALLNAERTGVMGDDYAVEYELDNGTRFSNSATREPGHYTSEELREYLHTGAVADAGFNALRNTFVAPPPPPAAQPPARRRAKPGV